jgi:hypothetical protein
MAKTEDTKPKAKHLHMRLTEEDEAVLSQLTEIYQMERSAIVRFSLEHVLNTRPTFKIVPTAKRQ